MEAAVVAFIVARTLVRWYSHPQVQQAHRCLDEVGVSAFLVQLDHLLLQLEGLFPRLTQQVILTAAAGAVTREQVVEIMREAGVTETQISLALGRT